MEKKKQEEKIAREKEDRQQAELMKGMEMSEYIK